MGTKPSTMMPYTAKTTRREMLVSSLFVPLAAVNAISAASANAEFGAGGKPLVAYFSRSGNTRTIAALLSRDLDGDLFEIESVTPYPADYFATVDQATRERERDFLPPLKASISNLSSYNTVFLGFPIWGASAPPIIRSFLANQDFSRKTIIPFNLHGGYGLGNSREIIINAAPQASFAPGFVMEGLQERRTTELVRDWLKKSAQTR
ncbi:flavodoxin [Mesorhizobium sp. GbtcB19]|uniref:flavodoxin n=1 Tax=Mesorhizobium sp. GbtcB19 TaxID=2824764 RepID=UPI0020C6C2CD|nr:flavodoxin [Mesorhizobium sp. GbtcB19]